MNDASSAEVKMMENTENRNTGRILVTGDKHGQIQELKRFCTRMETTPDDLLIILGDAGFNYGVSREWTKEDGKIISGKYSSLAINGSDSLHQKLFRLPLTIAVIQGNHEAPAWECEGFDEAEKWGGPVLQSRIAPNVFYLKNGEVYTFGNKEYLVLGGAYSIDRIYARRSVPYKGMEDLYGRFWFPEEQMSDEDLDKAFKNLEKRNHKIHGILSHTCPVSKMPKDLLLPEDPRFPEDLRMENRLEEIMEQTDFDVWYFGHFHDDRTVDENFRLLFHSFENLK